MPEATPKATCCSSKMQAGFTILELLIAVSIFSIVTGAVYGLLRAASADRAGTIQRTEILQSARNALNSVGRDALNAGYGFPREGARLPDNTLGTATGQATDTQSALDILPAVIPGRSVNPNTLTGVNTDQVCFVFQDMSFNSGQQVDVTAVAADGSQLTFDTDGPDNIAGNADDLTSAAVFPVNSLIMVSGPTSSAVGMVTAPPAGSPTNRVFFASTAPLSMNLTGASNNGIAAISSGNRTATRVSWVRYRVLADGTLVRTVVGNVTDAAGQQDQPLAYNIESMVIEYVMSDGTISTNPGAGTDGTLGTNDDTPDNLFKIRQVRLTITARSPEADPIAKLFYKTTLTATFNTRNLGYDTR